MKELTKKDTRLKGYYSKKKSSSTSSDNSAFSPQPPESEIESANESHDTVLLSGDDDDLIAESDKSFHKGLPTLDNQGGQSANLSIFMNCTVLWTLVTTNNNQIVCQ